MMMKATFLSSILGSVASFSVPSIHVHTHININSAKGVTFHGRDSDIHTRTRTLDREKQISWQLLAIPKREAKENVFEMQASTVVNLEAGDEQKDNNNDNGYDHEDGNRQEGGGSGLDVDLIVNAKHASIFSRVKSKLFLDHTQTQMDIWDVGTQLKNLEVSDVWKARMLLLLSAALYGTNFTYVKILNENVPVNFGTALRFSIAAAVTLPWLFQRPEMDVDVDIDIDIDIDIDTDTVQNTYDTGANANARDITNGFVDSNINASHKESAGLVPTTPLIPSHVSGAIVGGAEVGLWNSIGYLSQAQGLETTPAGTSAFICSLAVVVVPILDFFIGKKISSREAFGAMLAVVGVGFLELDGFMQQAGVVGTLADTNLVGLASLGASAGAGDGLNIHLSHGDMLSLVQPFAFGLGFWRIEHYMRKFPTEAMRITASQLSTIALASIAGFLVTSNADLPDVSQFMEWMATPVIVGALCWTGLITTALTVYMETLALKTLSAAETTMLFSTEPLFGGVCAATVLGEQFGVGGLIGGALVLAGCLASNIDMSSIESSD